MLNDIAPDYTRTTNTGDAIAPARLWHALYDSGVPVTPAPAHRTVLDAFRSGCRARPDAVLLHYRNQSITMADADRISDRAAAAFARRGMRGGDRIAIHLQNVPQFVLAALAAWKLGGIVTTVNPMYRARELRDVLSDSAPFALLCEATPEAHEWTTLARSLGVTVVLACDPDPASDDDWSRLVNDADENELHKPAAAIAPDSIATLLYTSGTTGPMKAVASTHRNLVLGAEVYRTWANLTPQDTAIAIAPLIHVTGMVGYIATALLVPMPLILTYRFSPATFAEAVARHRATFTIGPTTAFIALTEDSAVDASSIDSLRKCYSGGAPIPPATVDRFAAKFGHRFLGIYGLTEATGPTHIAPRGHPTPVDPASGALSVGVPVSGIDCSIVNEHGATQGPDQQGELILRGRQIAPSYWQRPTESTATFAADGLHTGDICLMDSAGWFYVIDRIKDQINASGFKVWPRDVEDALYEHAAVAECAVVGVPDPYRGETVRAFIVKRAGCDVDPAALETFMRERLAAYKIPRSFVFLKELPKTASGKILRRELKTINL